MTRFEVEIFYCHSFGNWFVVMYNPISEEFRMYKNGTLEHIIRILPKFNI